MLGCNYLDLKGMLRAAQARMYTAELPQILTRGSTAEAMHSAMILARRGLHRSAALESLQSSLDRHLWETLVVHNHIISLSTSLIFVEFLKVIVSFSALIQNDPLHQHLTV